MHSTDGSPESRCTKVNLSAFRFSSVIFVVGVAGVLTGCANQAQVRTASNGIDPRYGVRPSPRVVADGQPVPKGGGAAMVGKPYTIAGRTYYPSERPYSAVGLASWYGSDFHGRRTANGEVFDKMSVSAAHPTMPLPSYARITNLRNHRSMIVRVNDRGPYHANRVMDVSEQVAEALEFRRVGTARVKVDFVGRASLAGSDDSKLMATLRTDGTLAGLGREGAGITEVAQAEPETPTRVASARAVPVAAREEVADRDEEPAAEPVHAPKLAAAPLPPSRPFDLGTIPGAGVPVAASRSVAMRTPPRTIQAVLREDVPLPVRR